MGLRFLALLLALLLVLSTGKAATEDAVALQAMKAYMNNTPPSWLGADPCDDSWEGIACTNSRVTSITLSTMGLTGQLTGDIGTLSELQTLDLSYNKGLKGTLPDAIGNLKKLNNLILVGCGFTGVIPDTIGSLSELVFLSLNSNGFSGSIPSSIGNLSKLYWLDLADNQISGTIPVSNGSTPGLDMLLHTKHFHFGRNQISGSIPPQLFSSDMKLIHVLFDNNQLTGGLPSTLGLVQPLEVVRFDRNSLTGNVPVNLNNLTNVHELFISNNGFRGPLPNLTGLNSLSNLDLSNNSFDASNFPDWASTLQSLTTLVMERTQIQGPVPTSLFSLANLQTVILRNNRLNGTLNITSTYGNGLQLIDLHTNLIDSYVQISGGYSNELILVGNPICQQSGVETAAYCTLSQSNSSSYSTPSNNCIPMVCTTANQTSSPNCKCSFPYTGTIVFRAPSFSDLGNSTHYTFLASTMMNAFRLYQLPVDTVALSDPHKDSYGYLNLTIDIFPSDGDSFNRTGIYSVGFVLSNQTYKPPLQFGPFYFIGDQYESFAVQVTPAPSKSSSSVSIGVIIGAAIGGIVLLLLLGLAVAYALRQKKKSEKATESNLFGGWGSTKSSSSVPQLKGSRWFTFEELKKCTNNFSESSDIGSGGYGKVYRGILPAGQLVAIKRARQGSMQGGVEFKNEIELLSRVHHKNLVSLIGFCFEQGEQILVYEYIPNGTVKESLSGKSGIRLDWVRRLRVALGSARGIQYLHELADPPIIHRDIKSNNILLDEKLNAKVGDFGLCKPMSTDEKGHVTTQVKGTMGYLDPEYYMTQQLTEKSDVYSFGVFCLELVTARKPIEQGKYIVREVKSIMDRTKDMYGLHTLLDPALVSSAARPRGLERFVDMAMRCVAELGSERPTMGEVVKEIETVMQLAGLNPNAGSASTSASYADESTGISRHPYGDDLSFEYSGVFPQTKVKPQ